MTSGNLCMMTCPMLEDEMVYNLSTDLEEKHVFLIDNEYTKTLLPKMEDYNVKYTFVTLEDFLNNNIQYIENEYNVVIWMMNAGLHEEPEILKTEIKKLLKEADGCADCFLLYYGLCGNGLLGIDDWAKEELQSEFAIMRDSCGRICDDCICVPLDGTDNYLKLLRKYAGIMYLTPAFACNWDEFSKHMSMFKGMGTEDDEMMKLILEMAGYTKVMKIQTGLGDQKNFQKCCEDYAAKYNLNLVELEDGWVSTVAADKSYETAKNLLKK